MPEHRRAGCALPRRAVLRGAALWAASGGPLWARPRTASAWPAWDSFARQLLRPEGRVIANAQGQTHSEAQSYALLFALIANDRERFEHILRWTEEQLFGGDLASRLPAWLWGKRSDGGMGVLDDNAASDADLWIAYALAEAGRLWKVRRYRALSSVLAARIVREETADLPGLGPTLLPGPRGFAKEGERWRLNPSYVPLQALRLLASSTGDAVWRQLLASGQRLLIASAPRGFAPDWVLYTADDGFVPDWQGERQAPGAYNAIRVYLWAGMLDEGDAARASLLRVFAPMVRWVQEHGHPPETIDSQSGEARGAGPTGFSAALLPLLHASDAQQALAAQQQRLAAQPPADDAYYARCLTLFGRGWLDGCYRFAADGRLWPQWSAMA